jgi:hypothetical protein
LEIVTKGITQSRKRIDPDMCLSMMDVELRAVDTSMQRKTWSTDPTAITLKTRIDVLQLARASLFAPFEV